MKVTTPGVMRALGNQDNAVAAKYAGHEDEPLNTYKPNTPEGRIGQRIQRVKPPYTKPTTIQLNIFVDHYI